MTSAGFLTLAATPAVAGPGTTIDSSPSGPIVVGSSPVDATWTITTTAGTQCQLADTGSGDVVDGPQACSTGDVTFSIAGPGNYQLQVLPTSDPEVDSAALEADPPAPSIDSSPTSPFNDPTPSWSFTLDSGASASCEIDHPAGTAIQTVANCTSPFTADDLNASSTNGDPGHYTLSVVQTVNGTSSAAATSDYDYETAKPATPGVSADRSIGVGRHPSFTVTGLDAGATPTCSVVPSAGVSVGSCGASPTLDLTGAPDGNYTLHVSQTYAGNVSDDGTATYQLDTHTPSTPTISADATFGGSAAPSFTVGNIDGDATLECSVSGPSTVSVTTCDTSTVLDLTGADAGTYTVTVDAKDTAGAASPSASATYEYLPSAPPAPHVHATDPAGSGTSPQFTISDPENATLSYDCTVTAAGSDASLTVPAPSCGPTTTLDLSGAPDDTYTLSVTATDKLGQVGPVGSDTYTLDTATPKPLVSLASPASTPSTDTDPSFTIGDSETTDGPDTFRCEWDAPDGSTISNAPCASGDDFPTAGNGNGTYTLTVTATDAVGNHNTAAPVGYLLEAAAPPAPTVSIIGQQIGSSPTATFLVSDSENVSLTYDCAVQGQPAAVVTTCGPTTSIDLGSAPDGTYTLQVTATDELSQTSTPGTADYTLDSAALAPSVALTAPEVSPSTNTSPMFTITDNQVVGGPDSFSCTWSGPGITTPTPQACASGDTFPTSGDGDYTLSVTSTDAAGNISTTAGTADYSLDTTAPGAPTLVLATPASSPGSLKVPTFTVTNPGDTSPGGLTYTCTVTETSVTPAVTLPAGRVACGPTTTVHLGPTGDGDYTLVVNATDAAGNVGIAGTASYTLDSTAPTAPTVTLATPAGSPGSASSPTFTVSDSDPSPGGLTYSCTVTETSVTPNVTVPGSDVTCGSTTTVTLASTGDGAYSLAVTATDAAGNSSASPGTATYTLDATAPNPPTVVLATPASSPGKAMSPTFTVTDPGDTSPGGLTYSCTVTETSVTPNVTVPGSDVTCGPTTSVDLTSTGDGAYSLAVTATDGAGNTSPSAGTASYTLDTSVPNAPAVTLTSPASSPGHDTTPTFSVSDPDSSPGGVSFDCTVTDTSVTPNVAIPGSDVTCGSTTTVDLGAAGDGDGHYSLAVTATDAAGNVSPAGTASYTLDATAPATPIVALSSPSSPGHSTSPQFTVTDPGDTSPGGLTYSCQATNSSILLPAADITCGPTTTLDLSALPDDTYTLAVTATDAAGNSSTVAGTASYTLDTAAPNAPTVVLTSPAASPGNDTSPTFTVSDPGDTSPGGLTYSCTATETSTTPATTVAASHINCGPTTTLHLGSFADGDFTLSVTATDAAGNTSLTAGTASYTLDTTLPTAPTVVLATPSSSPGNSTSPQFSVSDPDGSPGGVTYNCSVTGPTTVPASDVTCGTTTTVDLSGGGRDGAYTLAVTATDAAGNVSSTGSAAYTLDTGVPAAPTVSLIAPGQSPGTLSSPQFAVTNPGDTSPGGLTYSCTVTETSVTPNVTVPGSKVTCGPTTTADLSSTGDGDYTLAVTATDAAGNTSLTSGSASYTLDTNAPAAPTVVLATPAGSPGHDTTPTFTVTNPGDASPGGLTYSCTVTETSVTPNVTVPGSKVTCGPTTTVDLSGAGRDGDYTLAVTATDAAGNVSPVGSATYTLDTTIPAAPTVVLATSAGTPGHDTSPTFTVSNPGDTSPGGLTYSCTVTETSVSPNVTVAASDVTCGPTTTVDLVSTGDGDYTLAVVASDAAGNVSLTSGSASYTLDTTNPATPTVVLATPAGSPGHDKNPTFTVTNPGDTSPGGLTYSCTVTETSVTPNVTLPAGRAACGPTTTVHLGPTGDGDYTLAVTATDGAGNVSTSAGTATYTLDATAPAAPTVTMSSPASSPGHDTNPTFAVSNPGDVSPGGLTYACTVTETSATPNVTVPGSDVTCGTTTAVDLTSTGDGSYTLAVTATDAAGNTSPAGSASYTMDTTVPNAPTVVLATPTGTPGHDTTPTFTVTDPGDTSPGGVTYSCTVTETSVTPNVTVPGSDVTCGPTTSVDLTSTGDGDYSLAVTATDAAGNISPSAGTATYTLDTSVPNQPAVSLTSPASSPGHDTNPTFSVSDPDGSPGGVTFACTVTETSVTPNVTLPGSDVTCGTTTSVDLSGAGRDGDYTLAVTATDAAGNVSSAGTASYTLDATTPSTPTVVLATPAGSPGHDTSPTFTVTNPGDVSPGGLTYACTLTETSVTPNVTLPGSDVTCGPTTSLDLSATGDGDFTLAVTATDAAGNVSPVGSASYTLDTAPPAAPTVVLATPASSPGHDTDPTFTVTNPGDTSPGGLTYSCTVIETSVTPNLTLPAGRVACGPTTTVHLGATGDGDYTLAVTATDAAGNVSATTGTASYTLDASAPAAPTVTLTSPASSPGHSTSPTFGVSDPGDTSPGGITYSCQATNSSTLVPAADITCGTSTTLDLSALPDDTYTLSVTATDAAGNVSPVGSASYTMDTTAPAAPTVTLSSPAGSPGNDTSPSFAVSDPGDTSPGGLTYSCTVTETSVTPNLTVSGSDVTCGPTTTADLSSTGDGDYTLAVTATDAAGNTSLTSGSASYTLDTNAPAAPTVVLATPAGTPGHDTTPTFTVTNPGDASPGGLTYSCTVTETSVTPNRTLAAGRIGCGPTTTVDLSGAGRDGDYTLAVTATDAAGNVSLVGSASYTLDATIPAAPIVTLTNPGGSPGNLSSPTFSVSNPGDVSPGGLTYSCTVTETSVSPNVTVAASDVTCGPTTTVDLSSTGDGDYTLAVVATDAAGNVSLTSGSASYTLDTTNPATPTVVLATPAGTPGHDKNPTFTVTNPGDVSPGGLTYSCTVTETSVTPNVTLPAGRVVCGPTTTVHLGPTGDGDYTLAVTATDTAGNVSTSAGTASYTLDTTVPNRPTVVLATPAGSPGHDTHPTFTVTNPGDASPGGLTYSCTVTETSSFPTLTVPSADVTCGPTTSVDLSTIGDGDFTVAVVATDAAGNVSPAGAASYTLDTTVPNAPTVVLATPAGTPGNDTTPTFTVTEPGDTSPGGLTYSCTLTETSVTPNVTVPGSNVTCGPTTFLDLSTAGDGDYTLAVTATDAAGNTSASAGSASYTLDTTAPPAPAITLPPQSTRLPAFGITDGDPTATLSCLFTAPRGRVIFPTGPQTTCPGNGTFDTTGSPDGDYTLTVTATDPAGNGSSTTVTWTRDTTPPPVPTVSAPASPSNNRSPVFTISDAEVGATLACQLTGPDSTGLVEFSGTCPASGKLPIAGNDGVYTLTVSATDAAGNTNPTSATATYTLDTTAPNAPTVTRISPASSLDNVTTARFTLTDPDSSPGGITYQCTVTAPGGVTVLSANVTCGSTTTVDLSATGDATYTVSVTATDAAGNVSPAGTATYTLDTTPPPSPQVTLTSPASSPGNVSSPTFTVTDADTSPGLTLSCTMSSFATPVPPSGISCGPSTTIDLSGGGRDGSYTLSVTATDAAGNTSTSAGTATYTLDTLAPDPPIVSLASAIKSNLKTPQWGWSFGLNDTDTAQETPTCTLNGPPGSGWTDTLPTCPHTLKPSLDGGDGQYTLTVTLTDEAGNTTSATGPTYTLDSTAPPGPTVQLKHPSKPAGRDRHPVWQVTAPPNTTALCTLLQGGLGGTPIVRQAPCPTPATYSLVGLPDGMYTLRVVAVDKVGNHSYPASANYVLSPAAPKVVAPKGHGPIAVWTVSGNPADKLSCTLLLGRDTVVGAHTCGTRPRFDMTSRPSGTYTLSVVQIGPQGATSAPGSARWFWRGTSPGHPVGPGGPGPGPGTQPSNPNPGHHGPAGSKSTGLAGFLPGAIRQRLHSVEHAVGTVVQPFAAAAHPNRIADAVSSAVQGVVAAVGSAGGGTGFPLLLVGLVVAFVIAQNRIDRRDPKLALASIAADDMVEFQLPPSRRKDRP